MTTAGKLLAAMQAIQKKVKSRRRPRSRRKRKNQIPSRPPQQRARKKPTAQQKRSEQSKQVISTGTFPCAVLAASNSIRIFGLMRARRKSAQAELAAEK